MKAKVKVYAKINYTLDITGKTGEYHDIDSVVFSVDLCDVVSVSPRKDGKITVKMAGGGEDIPEKENNAYKAADLFRRKYGVGGADIVVYKNIPIGKGLGGSSADAAGTLIALKKVYAVKDDVSDLASEVGSDCAYMLSGGAARMSGRGDKIKLLPDAELDMVLVFPDGEVNTAEAYRSFDAFSDDGFVSDPDGAEEAIICGDKEKLYKAAGNALAPAAERLCEGTRAALSEIRSLSPSACSVTGSGSAVFAVFDSPELCAWAADKMRKKGFRAITVKTVAGNRPKS